MQYLFSLLPIDFFIAGICRLHPDISGTKLMPFDQGVPITRHKPFAQQDLFAWWHLSGMRLGCSRDWRMFPWRSSYRDRQLVVKLASHSFTWSPPFFARSAEPTARKAPAPAAPDFRGLQESWQATPHSFTRSWQSQRSSGHQSWWWWEKRHRKVRARQSISFVI